MPLFRILVWLVVLAVCAVILTLIVNVVKAILIVAGVALALGLFLGLRRSRQRRPALRKAGDRHLTP